MPDILPFLKALISVSGVSGGEAPVAHLIAETWRPLVDEIALSRVGSLQALKKGSGQPARPSIMIAAHMDGIGMRVSKIADGFLQVAQIGALDLRVLAGAEVTVHATGSQRDLPAVVALAPGATGELALRHFFVDMGLQPREVQRQVRIGDLVSFANAPVELSDGVLSGHTVDNRASIAALTICLQQLQGRSHLWDVQAVATVQEETSYLGAYTSAFALRPQIAVVLDTTFARGPGASGWQTFPLGEGVGLCIGPNLHPFLHQRLKELADRLAIPWFLDVAPVDSGTDAVAVQITAEGIPTALVEMAVRYMHMPVECVAVRDIEWVGHLLAEFVTLLADDFMDTIVWE